MTALIDISRTSGTVPGSYFGNEHHHLLNRHMAYQSIFKPPISSPRPSNSRTPYSHGRSKYGRSASSIPRPVSRSSKDNEGTRKRPRLDTHSGRTTSTTSVASGRSTPRVASPAHSRTNSTFGWGSASDQGQSYFHVSSSTYNRDAISPPPFVNTSYHLAGGLDTPGASYERRLDEWGNQQEELDWRVNRYTSTNNSLEASTNWTSSMETSYVTAATSRNKLPRTPSSISGQGLKRSLEDSPQFETPAESLSASYPGYSATGWHLRSRAWALTGGLAFKAINFCWNTAFGGFSAGGGQSYAMDIGTPEVPRHGFRLSQVTAKDDVFSNHYEKQEDLPGMFPGEDFMEDYADGHMSFVSETGLSTPTTRGQHNDKALEIRRDWCMVDIPSPMEHNLGTAVRRRSRASIAGARSNSFRNTVVSRTSQDVPAGASVASSRARSRTGSHSLQRKVSNSSLNVQTVLSNTTSRPSLAGASPYRRQSSYGSTKDSPTKSVSERPQSPSVLSPEVAKYERKIRKRAKAEDESMSRMNAHLQELIRQGKEALGSKISIEHDNDNEGYYEDGYGHDSNEIFYSPKRAW